MNKTLAFCSIATILIVISFTSCTNKTEAISLKVSYYCDIEREVQTRANNYNTSIFVPKNIDIEFSTRDIKHCRISKEIVTDNTVFGGAFKTKDNKEVELQINISSNSIINDIKPNETANSLKNNKIDHTAKGRSTHKVTVITDKTDTTSYNMISNFSITISGEAENIDNEKAVNYFLTTNIANDCLSAIGNQILKDINSH